MSKLYDNYLTDKGAEANGVWIDDSGASFKLARMGGANTKFQRAMTAAMKPYMREIQLGVIDDTALEPIVRRVFAETILLDWKNVTGPSNPETPDVDGDAIDFSSDAAIKLFADLPDLYARLRTEAQSYANFRASSLAVASKN